MIGCLVCFKCSLVWLTSTWRWSLGPWTKTFAVVCVFIYLFLSLQVAWARQERWSTASGPSNRGRPASPSCSCAPVSSPKDSPSRPSLWALPQRRLNPASETRDQSSVRAAPLPHGSRERLQLTDLIKTRPFCLGVLGRRCLLYRWVLECGTLLQFDVLVIISPPLLSLYCLYSCIMFFPFNFSCNRMNEKKKKKAKKKAFVCLMEAFCTGQNL